MQVGKTTCKNCIPIFKISTSGFGQRDCPVVFVVLRGGNWNNNTNNGVFTTNLNWNTSNSNNNVGFRCVVIGVIFLRFRRDSKCLRTLPRAIFNNMSKTLPHFAPIRRCKMGRSLLFYNVIYSYV